MGNCFSNEEKKPRESTLPSHQDLNRSQQVPVSPNNVNVSINDPVRPLPSTPKVKDGLTVRALYDFDAINDDDLSFRKGDKLEVDEETSQNSDWWVATHLASGQKGYIPSNYVTKDDNSPQSQDWWYNVERKEADKQLLLPGNPTGTFLVREAGDRASYVLSVRDYDPKSNDACVKHYRIRRLDNGGFYISPKHAADGLCCKLDIACPKIRPLVQFRELEVARESVKLLKKLGSGCFGEVYAGMNGHEVLNRVEKGYRMPKPTGGPVICQEPYYEHMMKCWNRNPENRPTFAYLQDFFNNYLVAAEGEYKPMD
ncbi:HCK-like protein [Mya arenaria]|uniref:Tyrosine-protein kinase n=1 Tax=Mya arenaria TaxID=6604 RepID=A0ABY7FPR6_MYAAR|nr:HCK-like protein [Mya arenaria]